ncbi:MAG TPA: Spy/CpxP family protein refolding chaperone [Steroidobacteraceae bacterium]
MRLPARAAALGVTILAFALAGPAASQTPDTHMSAAHAGKDSAKDSAEDVEERIKSMHRNLGITAAQEPLWQQVADVMRENQREMQEAVDRRQQAKTMTAIDDLKAYEGIAKAHTKSLEKLIPAFEKLYSNLSSEQKAKADEIFGHNRHHA